MMAALLAGAAVGLGILLLVLVLSRPVPGIAATLNRIDRRAERSLTASAAKGLDGTLDGLRENLGGRLESFAAGRSWQFTRVRTDLAVMNRTVTQHMGTRCCWPWLPSSGSPASSG